MNALMMRQIASRLGAYPPPVLEQKIQAGGSLVPDLQQYQGQLRLAKRIADLTINADELLDYMLANLPAHGELFFNHRQWYNIEVQRINQYTASI